MAKHSVDTYPYEDGILKSFALIYATQRPDLSVKTINIVDPIELTFTTLYFDTAKALDTRIKELLCSGVRVLICRVYHTGLCLDISKWKKIGSIS